MDNIVVWLIIILFYAPLHYLLPMLVVFMRSDEQHRRSRLIATAIDCSLSMATAFALGIWLVSQERMSTAMWLLLASMFVPYLRLWLKGRGISAE